MKTNDEYYWVDDSDYSMCGSYPTEAEAIEDATENAKTTGNHTRAYMIVKVVSKSAVPSLKRTFKSV